ncbi:MAG: hypothetical protein HWE23_16890 [Rhodobacteraceae bacterium]|nr:hypothetical protein [Paracoccaceae bacterium]
MEIVVVGLLIIGVVVFAGRKKCSRQTASVTGAAWARRFAVYYLAKTASSPQSTQEPLPPELSGLFDREHDLDIEQPFLASLDIYLDRHEGRKRQPGDYEQALSETRALLAFETLAADNENSLRRWVRSEHLAETGEALNSEELEKLCKTMREQVAADERAKNYLFSQIFRFNTQGLFQTTYGKDIHSFMRQLYA